jgi:hypothetical protein
MLAEENELAAYCRESLRFYHVTPKKQLARNVIDEVTRTHQSICAVKVSKHESKTVWCIG